MSYAVEFKLEFNDAMLSPVERACAPSGQRVLVERLANDVRNVWRANFIDLAGREKTAFRSLHADPFYRAAHQRKEGKFKVMPTLEPGGGAGRSTGFWAQAAQATSYAVTSDTRAIVSVNQVGVRLQYLGGVVAAQDKLLAIPAIPEACGTNPEDWANLKFAPWLHGPKTVGALIDRDTGIVVWWLAEETAHHAHPEVIPLAQTQAALDARVQIFLGELARQINAQKGGGN